MLSGETRRLDRNEWRREAGRRDEGEWVSDWTVCVQQTDYDEEGSTEVEGSETIPFTIRTILSR